MCLDDACFVVVVISSSPSRWPMRGFHAGLVVGGKREGCGVARHETWPEQPGLLDCHLADWLPGSQVEKLLD
jgi:hypothetical protein